MARKDDPEQWNRLREEQIKALQDTEASIERWKQFISDFEALKKRLHTLPDQISHDVMVPFGKMAFMPGQLVHTNEILVLLGDNWFAERSAKQAAEIVDRRLKLAKDNLQDVEKQKQLLLPRQQITSELEQMSKGDGGMFEIREEYDEEKERQWKEAHRKRVKEQRSRQKQKETKMTTSPPMQTQTQSRSADEDIWARLDQLEQIETERREIQKVGTKAERKLEDYQYPAFQRGYKSNEECSSAATSEPLHIGTTDSEEEESSYSASDELDSDDDSDHIVDNDDDEEEIMGKGKLITFSHSHDQTKGDTSTSTDDPVEGGNNISSPADIYKIIVQSAKPKSILKKTITEPRKKLKQKIRKPVVAFQTDSDGDRSQVTPEPAKPLEPAFTASVIERSTPDISMTTQLVAGAPQQQSQVAPSRPVSKFKSRAANQNPSIPQTHELADNQTSDTVNTKPVSRFKAQRQKNFNN